MVTEPEFMRIVASIRGIEDPAFLDLPLEQTPFDSLDLLALRAELEHRLGQPLSDERFVFRTTLRDLYLKVRHVEAPAP